MTSQPKHRPLEPSIVVDPSLAGPGWSGEETVLFHRDMIIEPKLQPAKKRASLKPVLLLSVLLVLAAVALRLMLHR